MSAKDNAWGPAHEIGHIHQLAIDWPSSTESSNNLFSNFILYKLGKYCSRGTELNLPKAADNRTTNSEGNITGMTLSEAHCSCHIDRSVYLRLQRIPTFQKTRSDLLVRLHLPFEQTEVV